MDTELFAKKMRDYRVNAREVNKAVQVLIQKGISEEERVVLNAFYDAYQGFQARRAGQSYYGLEYDVQDDFFKLPELAETMQDESLVERLAGQVEDECSYACVRIVGDQVPEELWKFTEWLDWTRVAELAIMKTGQHVASLCDKCMETVCQNLGEDHKQLMADPDMSNTADALDMQHGLQALKLGTGVLETPQIIACPVTCQLNDGKLEYQYNGQIESCGEELDGFTQLPGIRHCDCAVEQGQDEHLLVSGSEDRTNVYGLAVDMSVYDLRIMKDGHTAEALMEQTKGLSGDEFKQVIEQQTESALDLYQQTLKLGLKKMAMIENTVSLDKQEQTQDLKQVKPSGIHH